jgi:hypothetical protein
MAAGFEGVAFESVKRVTEHLIRDGVDPDCRHV